jgi:DNA-binding Lrp family transcriptional regulator
MVKYLLNSPLLLFIEVSFMKKNDLFLLSCLRQNARMSLTKMSKKTGVPISTIFQKIRNNFDNNIIRNSALIDFASLGYNLKAYLLLRVKKEQKDSLLEKLNNNININNMFKINNSWDVLAECVFKDLNELEDFLDDLEENFVLKGKEVHYVLADLKREGFLSNPNVLELYGSSLN